VGEACGQRDVESLDRAKKLSAAFQGAFQQPSAMVAGEKKKARKPSVRVPY